MLPEGINPIEAERDEKGHRVYYGFGESKIILLLCGGSKATRQKDIKLAKAH